MQQVKLCLFELFKNHSSQKSVPSKISFKASSSSASFPWSGWSRSFSFFNISSLLHLFCLIRGITYSFFSFSGFVLQIKSWKCFYVQFRILLKKGGALINDSLYKMWHLNRLRTTFKRMVYHKTSIIPDQYMYTGTKIF